MRPVRLRDVPQALFAPRGFFARVEDVPRYGWPLMVLLAIVTLIGYAKVETGLIDREIDRQTSQRIAEIEKTQLDVVERSALRELYEEQYKLGDFLKLMARIQVIVAEPLRVIATLLVIAAVLYGMVALTGRKPEWHTLLNICVFAMFVEMIGLLTALGLMLYHQTLDVETSLALILRPLIGTEGLDPKGLAAAWGMLTAIDPFRIWFWFVVIAGLTTTMQLPGWRGWFAGTLCWAVAALVRTAILAGTVAQAAQVAGHG